MRWVIEYDCGKSIYMNDVFVPYYWEGDNDCYYLTKRVFLNLVKKTKADMNFLKNYLKFFRNYFKKIFHPTNIKGFFFCVLI